MNKGMSAFDGNRDILRQQAMSLAVQITEPSSAGDPEAIRGLLGRADQIYAWLRNDAGVQVSGTPMEPLLHGVDKSRASPRG